MTGGTADEWEFTVPADEVELLAELRRHGVRPGQRLHVALVVREPLVSAGDQPPEFFASFSGAPDLAERAERILTAEFPDRR